MTILFSPIGTADPITQLGDGPMLHIIRNREPDTVVLFLSPKMKRYQDKDQRFTKAIELLCQHKSVPMPHVELINSPSEEVYRFDAYIDEFEKVLLQLRETYPDEGFIVNVSSGTPACPRAPPPAKASRASGLSVSGTSTSVI